MPVKTEGAGEVTKDLTIKIPAGVVVKLKKTGQQAGHGNVDETVRNALAVYEHLIEGISEGKKVVFEDKDGTLINIVIK